ncbi:MAG: acyl-CoA dehydrogenase family protein [Planctomycetota bacterium]
MWRLDDEQRMLRDTVQQFAREEIAPRAAELDSKKAFPDGWFDAIAELGLFGMTLSEDKGGAGLGDLAAVLAVEELAAACGSTARVVATHLFQVVPAIESFGSDALQAEMLEELAAGTSLGAIAYAERQAGCDLGGLETRAQMSGENGTLHGTKTYVTGAGVCRRLVVAAKTSEERNVHALSLFLVDRDGEGVTVDGSPVSLGYRAAGAPTVMLAGAKGRLIGEVGQGAPILHDLKGRANLGAATIAIGVAKAAYTQGVEYAKTRKTFDVPIAEHQAIAFKIADMATDLEAARALVYQAASAADAGDESFGRSAAIAKLFATEAAQRCSFEAVQIFGGYGYSQEYPVERMYRDARMGTLSDGTSEMQRIAIAEASLA